MSEERTCLCGCGERFIPKREWQRYINPDHKRRFWRGDNTIARATQALEYATRAILTATREIEALRKSKSEGGLREKNEDTTGGLKKKRAAAYPPPSSSTALSEAEGSRR